MLRRGDTQPVNRRFPNGETHFSKKYRTAVKAVRSVRGEVKHLSTRRKGKQDTFSITIPSVAESERGAAQTASVSDRCGVGGQWNLAGNGKGKSQSVLLVERAGKRDRRG